jgi:phage gp36-like protein
MRGYLSSRYDCDKIFSATGDDRNQLVLMMALDIAIYHIFAIHNPRSMSQIRTDRYERAVDWLKGVRKGEISVEGLPEKEQEVQDASSQYQIRSNRKRINYF